jgi:hypothetical protein
MGLGFEFDAGTRPGVAINTNGTVVEVHKNELGFALYARTGTIDKATVRWNDLGKDADRKHYTKGIDPACAINANNVVVEVHKNEADVGRTIYSMYGTISGTKITWGASTPYDSDAEQPAVALIDSGLALTVYQRKGEKDLRLRFGRIDAKKKEVIWGGRSGFGTGTDPKVAMNNKKQVVAVWKQDKKLRIRLGAVNSSESGVDWWSEAADFADAGATPAVALTDDGFVAVVYKSGPVDLRQRTAWIDATNRKIVWTGESEYYDDGTDPVIAAAGSMSIEMHRGEEALRLWYSTSIITDRSNWMGDRLSQLGGKVLKQLAIPASHDSGMYTGGFSTIAKTQELSIYGQLANGIRYFDLRPGYDKRRDTFYIQHGGVAGPDLTQVLDDMRRFALEGHHEVWICYFDHFENFGKETDSTVYDKFTATIERSLKPWIYRNKPANKRLAEVTLGEYVAGGPAIVLAVAGDWALDYKKPGFWVYRDESSEKAAEGDLRVFDHYSKKIIYSDMRDDQVDKYLTYAGHCTGPKTKDVVCDLFLFSFTLTPKIGTGVWFHSKDPARGLGNVVKDLPEPNKHGQFLNMLYVDYCEFARVSDVALWTDNAPNAGATAGKAKTASKSAARIPIKAKSKTSPKGKPKPPASRPRRNV